VTPPGVYPGARIKPEESSNDEKDANVDLTFMGYGLRVVAIEYLSEDSPARSLPTIKTNSKSTATSSNATPPVTTSTWIPRAIPRS